MEDNTSEKTHISQGSENNLVKGVFVHNTKTRHVYGVISLIIILASIGFSLLIFHGSTKSKEIVFPAFSETDLLEPKISADVRPEESSCLYTTASLTSGYVIKDVKVYLHFRGKDLLVNGADPDTFECLRVYKSYSIENVDRWRFYGKDKNHVYFQDKIITMADSASFETFENTYYAKDNKNVYANGVLLPDADPETFKVEQSKLDFVNDRREIIISSIVNYETPDGYLNFAQDQYQVFANQTALPNSDPATFIHLPIQYSKDRNNVYYYNKVVLGADTSTFKFVDQPYLGFTRDENSVYHLGKKIIGADPTTFQVINSSLFSKDKNNVYYRAELLAEADNASFVNLLNVREYAYDKNYYYKNNEIIGDRDSTNIRVLEDRYLLIDNQLFVRGGIISEIQISDPLTLESLGAGYFKDSTSLYSAFHSPEVYSDADPENFAIYLPNIAVDKDSLVNNYYIRNGNKIILFIANSIGGRTEELIEGVDVTTFEPLEWPYSKDGNSVYFFGTKMEGAHASTFKVLRYNYALDKNAVYAGNQKIVGADPSSFMFLTSSFINYAYDKNNLYYMHRIVKGGEPYREIVEMVTAVNTEKLRSIEIVNNAFKIYIAIDDKNVYYKTQKLEGINPLELRIENDGTILRDSDTSWYLIYPCNADFYPGSIYVPESKIPDPENYKFECIDIPS